MAYKDYNFRVDDFRHMRFNVMAVPTNKDAVTYFQELGQYAEFKRKARRDGVSTNYIVRFLALMYDPQTPLKRIPDYFERKSVAAEAAGFKAGQDGVFPEPVQRVISLQDGDASLMQMRFLTLFRSMEFTMMQRLYVTIHEKLFYEEPKAAMAAMVEYQKLEKIVLNDDLGKESRQALYAILLSKEDAIRQLRPEHYAREYSKIKDDDGSDE